MSGISENICIKVQCEDVCIAHTYRVIDKCGTVTIMLYSYMVHGGKTAQHYTRRYNTMIYIYNEMQYK